MFLQVSVILLTGWGAWSRGGAWLQGCLIWGVPGPRGVPGPGGCLVLGGGCLVESPPPGTATAAGGTHPTGMHSC